MEIPKAVTKAAAWEIKEFPEAKIIYIGEYHNSYAFGIAMPNGSTTGYPSVFLLKNSKVRRVIGKEALYIISSLS